MKRKFNITKKQLRKLGFQKVTVSEADAGIPGGYYYYIYDFNNTEFYLISDASDERYKGKYFTILCGDYDKIKITNISDLKTILKIIKKNTNE